MATKVNIAIRHDNAVKRIVAMSQAISEVLDISTPHTPHSRIRDRDEQQAYLLQHIAEWLEKVHATITEIDNDFVDGDDGGNELTLEDFTVSELQSLARERGISYAGLRKAELIEALL
jgi:hypothetical protein